MHILYLPKESVQIRSRPENGGKELPDAAALGQQPNSISTGVDKGGNICILLESTYFEAESVSCERPELFYIRDREFATERRLDAGRDKMSAGIEDHCGNFRELLV